MVNEQGRHGVAGTHISFLSNAVQMAMPQQTCAIAGQNDATLTARLLTVTEQEC